MSSLCWCPGDSCPTESQRTDSERGHFVSKLGGLDSELAPPCISLRTTMSPSSHDPAMVAMGGGARVTLPS